MADPIVLSTGDTVTMKPFVTRKLMKDIHKFTYAGVELLRSPDGKVSLPSFDIVRNDEVADYAILQLIESVVRGDEKITPDEVYIENLSTADFALLKTAADNLTNPKQDDEKKA